MKNVLFEQEKIKVQTKWHFVENKIDYTAFLKNALYFLVA
jgi:hypothetical protein